MSRPRPRLLRLALAEDPAAWKGLGFTMEPPCWCRVGDVLLDIGLRSDDERGLVAWLPEAGHAWELAVMAEIETSPDPPGGPPPAHPNGAIGVDHVVVRTPNLERTVAELEADGLPCRGRREAGELRQAFHLFANALLEVVGPAEPSGDEPASFWGLTLVVEDLDATARLLGDRLGTVRDAVQPGRRIATVRRTSGIRTPLAFMTPRA